MFISIRRYKVVAGAYDELERRAQEDFLPRIRQAEGFSDYYWVRTSPEAFLTISVFEDRQQAEASNRMASEWIRNNNMASKILGQAEIYLGDMIFEAHGGEYRPAAQPSATPAQPPIH